MWIDSQPTAATLHHYIIVRPDIPRGILAAQITHAAGESSPGQLAPGTYAVVLQADQSGLGDLERRLQQHGVPHRAIRESDPPYEGDLMAIGIVPTRKEKVRRYVSSLPLLR